MPNALAVWRRAGPFEKLASPPAGGEESPWSGVLKPAIRHNSSPRQRAKTHRHTVHPDVETGDAGRLQNTPMQKKK
jgi:hypothetical protein